MICYGWDEGALKWTSKRVFMRTKPIQTESDYRRVLKQIEGLMDAQPDTTRGNRLNILATLADAWEPKYHAIGEPDPKYQPSE